MINCKVHFSWHYIIQHSFFSVPGIAERIAFGTLKPDEYFMIFNKKNADLVDLFRRNNVGGPAIIFDRHQEAGNKLIYFYNF